MSILTASESKSVTPRNLLCTAKMRLMKGGVMWKLRYMKVYCPQMSV